MATNFEEIQSPFEGERTFSDRNMDSDSESSPLTPVEERRNDEYYSVLNVARDADEYELKRAFNQMCLRYHPDRYTDPSKKQTAQELFHKVRQAYEVLRDPGKRAIYDAHGRKGLESNWTVAIRHPSLYEHEVFLRLREEIEEIQSYTPTGSFSASLDLTKIEQIQSKNGIDLARTGQYIQTKDISIQENIYTQIGPTTRLSLGGGVSLRDKEGHKGNFFLGVSHTSSSGYYTQVIGSIGNWPSIRVQLRKQIFDKVQLNLIGMVRFAGPYFSCIGIPTITTQLGDRTHFSLQAQIGKSSMKLVPQLSRQLTANLHLSTKCEIEPDNTSVTLELSYIPVKQYLVSLGIKIALKSQKLTYALQRSFSEHSTLRVGFSFANPGGVKVKFSLTRYNHTFTLPIRFSDRITLQKSIYVHILPIAVYGLAYIVYNSPLFSWTRMKLNEDSAHIREEQLQKETRRQAEVALMSEAYDRSLAAESGRDGLVVREAWFGLLRSRSGVADKLIGEGLPCVLDVTVPLQCLVKDSKLVLTDTSKIHLAGFYDVHKGERKDLNVKYYFRGRLHEVTVEDFHPLSIPKRSHQLRP